MWREMREWRGTGSWIPYPFLVTRPGRTVEPVVFPVKFLRFSDEFHQSTTGNSLPTFTLHFAPKIDGVLAPYDEERNRGFRGHHGDNQPLQQHSPSITTTNRLLPSLRTKPKQWWRRRSEYGG
ncbi:hypothetical protein ACFX2C_021988 [Malus domestica]